jgi:hypothetical protein
LNSYLLGATLAVLAIAGGVSLVAFYGLQHCHDGGKWALTEKDASACVK